MMVTVKFDGHVYDCEGEWVPRVPARVGCSNDDAAPAEGGYFEDFEAMDEEGNYVTDVETFLDLEALACEEVCDERTLDEP